VRGADDVAGAAGALDVVGAQEVHVQLVHRAHQLRQVAGGEPVVAVHEGQVLALCLVDAGVAQRGDPGVVAADHARARQ